MTGNEKYRAVSVIYTGRSALGQLTENKEGEKRPRHFYFYIYRCIYLNSWARAPTRPRFRLRRENSCFVCGAGDSRNEGADALLNNLARGQATRERLKRAELMSCWNAVVGAVFQPLCSSCRFINPYKETQFWSLFELCLPQIISYLSVISAECRSPLYLI